MTLLRSVLSRRSLLACGAAAGLVLAGRTAFAAPGDMAVPVTGFGVRPDQTADQSRAIQKAFDAAAASRTPLFFPAGSYVASELVAASGLRLIGVPGASRLVHAGGANIVSARKCDHLGLDGLTLDGGNLPVREGEGLLSVRDGTAVTIRDCGFIGSLGHGLVLERVAGEVAGCTFDDAAQTALFALDSTGLAVRANLVRRAGNNGIQIWRSVPGEDGSLVIGNRIEGVAAQDGGTGENGNGVNVFRAGNVIVADNRIGACAFSAVRCNSSSNVQIIGNNCTAVGEASLFVEFGYQGAIVANNLVDGASIGISVTNFDNGGRLAVVQGNVVRNLVQIPPPVMARDALAGVGIDVEADAAVSGNVIEGAPFVGIRLGNGPYLRDVVVTGNVIRRSGIAIGISLVEGVGEAVISDNLIAEAANGAVVGLAWDKPMTGDLLAAGATPDPRLTLSGNRVR